LFKTKSDLKAEEDKAISLNATHVLKNLDEDGARDKINDVDSFLAELGKPIKATVPVVRAGITPSQLSVSRSSHPSMDGVVVVRPPLAGIGTGLFVAPNLILTNYHVVEGLNHVPIELSNGSVGTGRVVDLDINRDLALIKTDVSGAPLELYAGHTLPLGESVVAIGHPSGLTFTVTKGIISAVREQRSRMSRGFGSEYLFVQTDTAISPGNSGGPLLLAGKVIGINTEKLVDVDVEGVGFALHYAEISRFLAAARSN
jgi:serine protease Do